MLTKKTFSSLLKEYKKYWQSLVSIRERQLKTLEMLEKKLNKKISTLKKQSS